MGYVGGEGIKEKVKKVPDRVCGWQIVCGDRASGGIGL